MRTLLRVVTCMLVAYGASAEEARVEGVAFRPERRDATEERVATLQVPDGFRVNVFARDLGGPRMMAFGSDTLYVTRPEEGDVLALRYGGATASERKTFVSGLAGVHGIALRESRMLLATPRQVFQIDLAAGAAPQPRVLIDDLPDGGQHPNRTLGFGPDGALYVSVGSSCNACQESNPEHATLLQADADSGVRKVFAEGLRNTIGFAWHPASGVLYGMDHGSDWLGDEEPREELNQIQRGRHYGWPYCWNDRREDPVMKDPAGKAAERGATKAAFCAKTEPFVVGYDAHAAPIAMLFYQGETFPAPFRHAAFAAMHGSWNRKPASGYEVVMIPFDDAGRPTGFEPFLRGFLIENGAAHFGRPAGLAIAPDGALLVSDDANGVIYRVSYAQESAGR